MSACHFSLWRRPLAALAAAGVLALLAGTAQAQDDFIIVQSTTSTENSGLFGAIVPKFTEATGIEVRVVAVGTGQAIKNAKNCDGDVLFVHDKPSEEAFTAEGYGTERFDVMYNDFVLVGPESDPAGIAGMKDAQTALGRIAESRAPFASRGDDSGTHKTELRLWQKAGVDVEAASGSWYRATGSGMGPTINTAVGMNAYTLADRASWVAHRNKGDLEILVEGDDDLFNQYGVILVNPDRCPNVKAGLGHDFIQWLLSLEGQKAIADYRVDGEQLFFPNAPIGDTKRAG